MDVVTGAFGYIGKYISKALLERGRTVCTITTHPTKPNPFGPAVKAFSYSFDDAEALTRTLNAADTLYNTYWIRFPFDGQTYEYALENTKTLFRCAKEAGVKRIVHIGVTRASLDSDLPYYRGKAIQESMLRESGVPFSIVRPTLVFGKEDILVNNIAWLIRTSPVFPIFGSGRYRVQPVFVEDLAEITIRQSTSTAGATVDAIGPETFTFHELVALIAEKIGKNPIFVKVPASLGISCGHILGIFLRDVLLTRNELKGLMDEMLTSEQAPNGTTRFSDWLERNKSTVGGFYSSEVARHFRWSAS
ncbi:MAG: NAD-dependent epimerase/dehydratase family protein [Terriglobia bacterium]